MTNGLAADKTPSPSNKKPRKVPPCYRKALTFVVIFSG